MPSTRRQLEIAQRVAQLTDEMPETKRLKDGSKFPPNSGGVSISYLPQLADVIDECAENLKKELLKDNKKNNDLSTVIFNKQYEDDSDKDPDTEDDSDKKRKVRYITPEDMESWPFLEVLKKQIIFHARQINPKYTHVHNMALIVSEEGCQKQITHTDGLVDGDQFLSSLFTLSDNTNFYVNNKKITVGKCTLFTFHSLTEHSGGEYLTEENVRIHSYIGTPSTSFPDDTVGRVHKFCKYNCGRGFAIRQRLYDHHRICENRPEDKKMTAEKMEQRKRQKIPVHRRR